MSSRPRDLGRALAELAAGPPQTPLPPDAFVRFPARRLQNARVVWVNWSLLRDWGVDVPTGGLTDDLERTLLDHLAWAVPVAEGDGRTEHVGPPKQFYADRYAGEGIGINAGSGRAGTVGAIQIKGIGTTPLAHRHSDHEHRHGALYLEEAMREAVWSELDHLEMPHGANRVLAVIDAMAVVPMPDGRRRRRGLLARPFPLRPAHYLVSPRHKVDPRSFQQRQRTIIDGFAAVAGPRIRGGAPRQLRDGFVALVDRLAAQHATLMAQRVPHGGLSASNVELSGRLLDFGSQTAQPGHGNTKILRNTPFESNAHTYVLDAVRSLAVAVGLGVSRDLARVIPDPDRLVDRFRVTHARTLYARLIALCGFPGFLLRHEARTAAYWRLARCLEDVAFAPGPPVVIERRTPRWLGDVDLGAALYSLACLRRRGPARAIALMTSDPRGKVAALIRAYFEFRVALDRHARTYRLDDRALDDLIVRLAAIRNESRDTLYLRRLRRNNSAVLRAYMASNDPRLISDRIEHLIARNRRVFSDAARCCVLREWHDRSTSAVVRYVFVPRRGYALEERRGSESTRVWLTPDVTRHAGLELLPRVYFDGVTQVTRDRTLPRAILPPDSARKIDCQ